MVNVEWCLKFSFKHAGSIFHVYTEADRDCESQTMTCYSKPSHSFTTPKTPKPKSKLMCAGPSCCCDDA